MRSGPHFQFVVHPLPGSAEQLADKLREVGEKLRSPQTVSGSSRISPIVPGIPPLGSERNSLSGSAATSSGSLGPLGISIGSRFDHGIGSSQVSQIEVGPSHFAFLLSDGRICRLPFSVISDRLDLSRPGSDGLNTSSGLNVGGASSAPGALSGGAGPSSSKSAKTSHSSTAGKINRLNIALLPLKTRFILLAEINFIFLLLYLGSSGVRQTPRRGHRIIRTSSSTLRGWF